MAGLSLVRPWSWVSFANLQEARFPILQESAYTTDSDTELSLALHVRFWLWIQPVDATQLNSV